MAELITFYMRHLSQENNECIFNRSHEIRDIKVKHVLIVVNHI